MALPKLQHLQSPKDYQPFLNALRKQPPDQQAPLLKEWCQSDLYFLLRYILKRSDIEHQWVFDRCREVQENPDGYLDLWARFHYKSTIITYGHTILDIIRNPELTIGFFSHTRPIAKAFLRQIMREFEANDDLKMLFPEIFWANPKKEAPKWSEDDGIVVKRKGNPKESTIEAWGIVDGQPTSKHFDILNYDDLVTKDSVTTSDMIKKVTESWELSRSLGKADGTTKTRYEGSRYDFNDTYREIMRRGSAKLRMHPVTIQGTVEGDPVLLSREYVAELRKDMGPYTFAAQMLLNPIAEDIQGFKEQWLNYYEGVNSGTGMNKYLLVDPASSKKKSGDYTTMGVIGLGGDQNYYLLDGLRDRLSLTQRADALFEFHRRWRPQGVGYEQYGMQADIEHFKDRMGRENYRFAITPLGGKTAKPDRIRGLIPSMEQGRWYWPQSLLKTNYEKKMYDLIQIAIEEELKPFPVSLHDDFLDMLARILDEELGTIWPKGAPVEERYARSRRKVRSGSYMAA